MSMATPPGDMDFPFSPFIDGRFHTEPDLAALPRRSPVDGRDLPAIGDCGERDVDLAVGAARRSFADGRWRSLPFSARKSVMIELARCIETEAESLARFDVLSMGKAVRALLDHDIPKAAECFRWFGEAIDKVYDECAPARPGSIGLMVSEPLGVVGAISPWNYPMENVAWKVAPALAAGNSIVLKPAEQSTYSALAFAELAMRAGIPAGVINVIPGGGPHTGRLLASHRDVDGIFFTGSTDTGRRMYEYAAASGIKHIGLECGGKSAFIVLGDCEDLPRAAATLARGIFSNQGQTCNAPSRLIVQRSVQEKLLELLVRESEQYGPGDPRDPDTRVGALVSHEALRSVMGYIEDGKRHGAALVCGGSPREVVPGGCYCEPTILTDVTASSRLAQEEIFGPVLSVIPVDDWREAVNVANDSRYGLAAGIFTAHSTRALEMARAVRSGAVYVNCYGGDDITMPFGGYKQSGNGMRDKALAAYRDHCERKTIVLHHGN